MRGSGLVRVRVRVLKVRATARARLEVRVRRIMVRCAGRARARVMVRCAGRAGRRGCPGSTPRSSHAPRAAAGTPREAPVPMAAVVGRGPARLSARTLSVRARPPEGSGALGLGQAASATRPDGGKTGGS